ncbi:hypothetical protein [Kineosporia sp. R_H_3]|uniref:hypothetical protein n=1 Tax=Kineosporia sp. R_H_3 TaxID=1961848 RepID=UPI000B4ACD00|nr:hypothetical protein [Kineosporia sp. R_H_3]
MSTSTYTSTVTHGVAGADGLATAEHLSRRITAAALAYSEVGSAVQRRREVNIPERVLVQLVWEFGLATVTINDPDTAREVAAILGVTPYPTRTPNLHTWRGLVCDVPVVLVGRGRLADDLTPEAAARLIAEIRALDEVATTLDVTA